MKTTIQRDAEAVVSLWTAAKGDEDFKCMFNNMHVSYQRLSWKVLALEDGEWTEWAEEAQNFLGEILDEIDRREM